MSGRGRGGLGRAGWAALQSCWLAARTETAGMLVLTALAGALPPVSAWLGRSLFDELAGGQPDGGAVLPLAVGIAAALGAVTVAGLAVGYCAAIVRAEVAVVVEDRLVGAVGALRGLRTLEDPAFLDRVRMAEQGAQEAPPAVLALAREGVRATIVVALFGGAVLLVWPPMMWLLAGSLLPAVASQLALARLRAREAAATAATDRRRFMYRILAADVRAAKEIRLFGLAGLFRSRMLAALRYASGAECAVQRTIALTGAALAALSATVSGVALVIAAGRAARGDLSVGDVSLFTAAVAGIQSAMGGVVGQLGRTSGALRLFERYLAVLDTADDLPSGSAVPAPLRTGIEFRDVWFRYDEGGPWVLRGMDLLIPAGAAVGLVGMNGAGKSTVIKLLCRFYDPDRGQIRWDGVDLRQFDVAALRRRIGATFQDFMSYDLTAAENIGIGDVDRLGDLPQIRAAGRLAEIDEHLAGLPRGYQTLLSRAFLDSDDQSGAMLSGGQWQRVALARSLLRDRADLVILDEPSSGLDAEAEHRVSQALRAHRVGRTSLLVSHRLSTLRDADLIVVLKDGRIAERGSHRDLVDSGGEYARLFALQARGYRGPLTRAGP